MFNIYVNNRETKHVIPAVFVLTDIGGGIRGIVASCTCAKCIIEHRRLLANGGRVIPRDMEVYWRLRLRVG